MSESGATWSICRVRGFAEKWKRLPEILFETLPKLEINPPGDEIGSEFEVSEAQVEKVLEKIVLLPIELFGPVCLHLWLNRADRSEHEFASLDDPAHDRCNVIPIVVQTLPCHLGNVNNDGRN
jgi:hypothetical protein